MLLNGSLIQNFIQTNELLDGILGLVRGTQERNPRKLFAIVCGHLKKNQFHLITANLPHVCPSQQSIE